MSHDHSHAEGHGGHAELQIHIKGMHCGDCEQKVLAAVNALPESQSVHDVQCSHATGKLTMCCDGNKEAVLAAMQRAIEQSGFHYEGCGHGDGASHGHGHAHSH
jgi:copper chaperone CopZ